MAENENKPGNGSAKNTDVAKAEPARAEATKPRNVRLAVRWPLDNFIVGEHTVTRKSKDFSEAVADKIRAAAKNSGVKLVEEGDK